MGRIRGIIFDKDGTLFDYAKVWGPTLSALLSDGLERAGIKPERKATAMADFAEALGVDQEGNIYPDGVLFAHDKMAKAVLRLLAATLRHHLNPVTVCRLFLQAQRKEGIDTAKMLEGLDFSAVRTLLGECQKRGYKLALITYDSLRSTDIFIEKMGIRPFLSFVRAKDSGIRRKPSPQAIEEFSRETGIPASEMALVGDAPIDMKMARKGKVGYKIAVLTGTRAKESLEKTADAVYPDISGLLGDEVLFPRC